MKCIAYISKAPLTKVGVCLPIGLSDIVKASNRNQKAGMTGFLCYRQGYYFQVIEGPSKEVSQLASRISVDSRHSDPWIFINKRISERCFKEWKVSVFNFVDQSLLFEQFITGYRAEIVNLTEQQKLRIQHFYDSKAIYDLKSDIAPLQKNYEGKNLRLTAWPDFNRIGHSQTMIDLCVKLTKNPYPFDQLVADGQLGTRDEVVKTLIQFEGLGILTVTESELPKQQEEEKEVTNTKKPSSFYGAIKRFLGMR